MGQVNPRHRPVIEATLQALIQAYLVNQIEEPVTQALHNLAFLKAVARRHGNSWKEVVQALSERILSLVRDSTLCVLRCLTRPHRAMGERMLKTSSVLATNFWKGRRHCYLFSCPVPPRFAHRSRPRTWVVKPTSFSLGHLHLRSRSTNLPSSSSSPAHGLVFYLSVTLPTIEVS